MTQGENASNRDDKEGGSPIETEGDHDMKQISSPQVSLPPTPAMTNRPPSVASTHSNTSGSRMTTTSRRGGRTRSRSPPSIINSRKDYDHAPMEGRSKSPANPSSAAAAAAAAAKALSSSSGARNPSQWYEGRGEDTRREDGRYRHGYEFQGSRNWPGEEAAADRRQHYRQSRPRDMEDPRYSRAGYQQGRRQMELYGAPYDDPARYQDSRGRSPFVGTRSGRSSSPYDTRHRYDHRREEGYYRGPEEGMKPHPYNSPKGAHHEASTPSSTAKRSGGTSRVIGTATPIHVPRAPEPPRHAPAGTPSSVFRGRPAGDATETAPGTHSSPDEDGHQKILLSLRTPTTSFEDTKSRKSKPEGTGPMSPEAPPQIQHSHHQGQMDQTLFFDSQRGSPKPSGSGTLEMTPSFSLFNQSFDSLGDTAQYLNVGGPLDGSFPSTSFGGENGSGEALPMPGSFSASGDRTSSLLASSSTGLTFGMSPVNSFGNGPSTNTKRASGNMMVLGGPDQQATSPTQMLGMYPSYSSGYGSQSSAPFRSRNTQGGESSMRTMNSGNSFGGQNMYNRSYSGPEGSPHSSYQVKVTHEASQEGVPSFYTFLGRHKAAFIKCSFLLPGLKASLLESPISDQKKSGEEVDTGRRKLSMGGLHSRFPDPSPQDIAVAMRRVASAICAFGGSITGDRGIARPKDKESNQSIFRDKENKRPIQTVTVTPSSSSGTPPGHSGSQSRAKLKYDELLPTRYYENENRLSWEFEESPPVGEHDPGEFAKKEDSNIHEEQGEDKEPDTVNSQDMEDPSRLGVASPQPIKSGSMEGGKKEMPPSDQPKMRYRCKLCGLPKQNHTCAFQQSLQRSIGTMVYPAVNAFTSSEPGMLAPALSDMNNFISSGSESISSTETSPNRPTPDRARTGTMGPNAPNVTPETSRSGGSPTGSATGSSTPQRNPFRTPSSAKRKSRGANMSGGAAMSQLVGPASPSGASASRKRPHSQISSDEDLLFVDTVDLKPEQFRLITPSKKGNSSDMYTYPALPLPYAQRKRLSDNLFALSKEVPQLTDECAVVLREAREKDMWDLAVAELMTQVVVVIHCPDGDSRFEGLRHYLLTLGIAC